MRIDGKRWGAIAKQSETTSDIPEPIQKLSKHPPTREQYATEPDIYTWLTMEYAESDVKNYGATKR